MKNKKITRKISQGVYVLTTKGGGCIVDAVSQVSSGDNPLLAVSVMKTNYTHELMKENQTFCLSVLGINVNPMIIENFGMKSMREYDKFLDFQGETVNDLKIISDSLGYMICEKVDEIDCETHTLFIGRLIEADLYANEKEMTYTYYQEHKDELIKVTTQKGKVAWVCKVCNYVVYADELPDDYICPKCGVTKDFFIRKED